MLSAEQLSNEYFEWATKNIDFSLDSSKNWVLIKTPFVDMYNDQIEIFVEQKNDYYIVSDDGYTLDELDTLGFDFRSSTKRKKIFDSILLNFGVTVKNSELIITIQNIKEFPSAQNRLIQCMIQTFDLLQTTREKVANFFLDDISNFFLEKELPFSTNLSITGKTGNPANFEFILGKTKNAPERALKTVNRPTPTAYQEPLMKIVDVRDYKPQMKFYILANDTDISLSDSFINSFVNYNIEILKWSQKDQWVNRLKVGI